MADHDIILLVMISAGAFVIPFLTKKISMPNAAGEIIYGLLIGYFFIRGNSLPEPILFLGELGFILLMYLAGLEIDFKRIRKTSRKDIAIFVLMYLIIIVASSGLAYYMELPGIFSLVLLTTAVGLLFPVLKDTGILHSGAGQRFLLIGTIGEVISLMAFTGFILYYSYGLTLASLTHIVEILAFSAVIYFANKLYRYFLWWFPSLSRLIMRSDNTFESSVRGNLANMLLFVALAAALNLELIIGAFLGGMLFAAIFTEKEDVLEKMGSFGYGFLVPVFFITVGMKFNVTDFINLTVLVWSLGITVSVLAVRILAAPVLLLIGMSVREMSATAISLTFPLTLLVAIATFGMDSGIIAKTHTASILLAAIITSVIYPVLFKKILSNRQMEGHIL